MAVAGVTSAVVLSPFIVTSPPTAVPGFVVASGCLEALYVLALSAAYRRGDLSLTYPIGRGTAPFLATIIGWIALGQRPALVAALGAMGLGAGLVVLALDARRTRSLEAVAFALLVGVTIASYSVVDGRAVHQTSPLGYIGVSFALQGLIVAAVVRFDRDRLRAALKPGVQISLGSMGAYVMVLYAFRLAPVGRVATLREISVLIAILLANERASKHRWLGAAMCVTGAILAAL